MKMILFGPPAAGKGTFAGLLKKVLPDHPHISTGDIFRENIKEGTPLGLAANEYLTSGKLVPDEVTIGMVKDRLSRPDCEKGFILDGFPRTTAQARALDEMTEIDRVFEIMATRDEIVERVVYRVSCPQCGEIYNLKNKPPKREGVCDVCGGKLEHRADDNEETIHNRIDAYEQSSRPLLEEYRKRGILVEVDGSILLKIGDEEVRNILESEPLPPA
ncbi:MAG: adenylate kinase [Promethearchaeota archaeon]